MNMPTVNNSASYASDRQSTAVQIRGLDVTDVENITTVEALNKAELQGEKVTAGEEHFIRSVDRALKALGGHSMTFERSVHESTNTIIVKAMDKETGEVVLEFPPEKILDMVAKFMEMNGTIVDKKV